MEYNLVDMDKVLKDVDLLYAHTGGKKGKKETLREHSDLVMDYLNKLEESKDVLEKAKGIIDCLCEDCSDINSKAHRDFIFDLFVNGVYLHDVGKSNPAFQYRTMGNNRFKDTDLGTNHSLLSALIYLDTYHKRAKEQSLTRNVVDKVRNRKNCINFIINSFAYGISRHHSDLQDVVFDDLLMGLNNIDPKMCESYLGKNDNLPERLKEGFKSPTCKSQYLYILIKLFYSVLVTCDFAATYEYMNGKEADICDKVDLTELADKYNNRSLVRDIRAGKNTEGINRLRTEIFLESEERLRENPDKYIYYLEAPTGSGKTNTSINLAMNLVKEHGCTNIFYVFPFNTLAEQTYQVMDFWEEGKDFTLINSTTPISYNKSSEENLSYDEVFFNYQLANFPVVITSHVRMFRTLFGVSREGSIWLYKLCNSVIILDEIQSYRNSLWSRMINILYKYAKALNIKILIMSATLPRLDALIEGPGDFVCELINSERYFQDPLFKNRVIPNYDYLKKHKRPESKEEKEEYIERLSTEIVDTYRNNPGKKILVEFITKKSARKCYEHLCEMLENSEVVRELTGDDNKAIRKDTIDGIKEGRISIVVATQVIEAGVDIDMDIGFKDISTIDSEEQFMGRINRSCKRSGVVYFFDCDKENKIYSSDVRTNFTLRDEKYRDYLKAKDFRAYYSLVLEKLKKEAKSKAFSVNNINFEHELEKLQFVRVKDALKLIDNNCYQIVLNYIIDGVEYSGEEVWNLYKELLANKSNLSYGEFKIKLSYVNSLLDMFTFNVFGKDKGIKNYTECIGGYYYYRDGEVYITHEGKFNREQFEKDMGDIFL